MKVDVVMLVHDSSRDGVEALRCLHQAEGTVEVVSVTLSERNPTGRSTDELLLQASDYGWVVNSVADRLSRPAARTECLTHVNSDWVLFINETTRLSSEYLDSLSGKCSPPVGAVQGWNEDHGRTWPVSPEPLTGDHAALIRTRVLDGISYPHDMRVLTGEWTRKYVEAQGYVWVLDRDAGFSGKPARADLIGWEGGFVGAKYGITRFEQVACGLDRSLRESRSPGPWLMGMLGWIIGSRTSSPAHGLNPRIERLIRTEWERTPETLPSYRLRNRLKTVVRFGRRNR